jgi:protein-disulfide isomerase
VAAFLFASPPGALAQTSQVETLEKEIEALKQGQASLRKELQELKSAILGARQPPLLQDKGVSTGTLVNVADAVFKGGKESRVTIVEFSDYQCPFCARHVRSTLPQLDKEYISTGAVKYVFRDTPVENLHPRAPKAHEAARCAGEQGKYWPMHDVLFTRQQALGVEDLASHAGGIGLDVAEFRRCLDGGKYAAAVRADLVEAAKFGVRGTPTFLVGRTEPGGAGMTVTATIIGAQPFTRFKDAIEEALGSVSAPATTP